MRASLTQTLTVYVSIPTSRHLHQLLPTRFANANSCHHHCCCEQCLQLLAHHSKALAQSS